jgi:hypothetical protein
MPTTDTSYTSSPTFGMKLDLHRLNLDANMYSFALNAMASDKSGNNYFLKNEGSNLCSVSFPPNYRVVGFKEIPELNRTIYYLTNPLTGGNQIGEVINCNYKDVTDKIEKVFCKDCGEYAGQEQTPLEQRQEQCYCQYRLIISDPCLNFNVHYPVDIEYKITSCQLQLYFTDNYNERRFIYFDFTDNDPTKPLFLSNDFKICNASDNGCTCPDGYTYDEQTLQCIKRVVTPLIPSGDVRIACANSDQSYSNFGVALYSTFNTNGTGISNIYHATDLYWSNPTPTFVDGVLNRTALWACGSDGNPQTGVMTPLNEPIGFIFPVEVPFTKTYYVGIAGDNKIRIRVDCNTIVDMDASALGLQYGTGLPAAFKFWHVYPVTLTAGRHVFELTGTNFGSVAGFGAEIYDNTAAEIIAAIGGVGLNILFSTHNMRGLPLQISSTFSGTCANPNACVDVDDDGNLFCVTTLTTEADCDDCRPIVCTDQLDCDKLLYHPKLHDPCIEFIDFVNGGHLKEGVYQVLIAYADVHSNPTSSYFASSQTAPLFVDKIKFETNRETSKALKFRVHNLRADSIFKYYNIVVARTIDNFTEFVLVGTFSTNQTEYVYTGFEKAPRLLTAAEVFFKRPFYEKARGVASANNYLFFTGVKEYEQLNLQPIANKVVLQWQTVGIKEKDYYDPRNTFYFHSGMRDEVYPYGIIFEFDNVRETCAFHIPGRAAKASDLVPVSNGDVLPDDGCEPEDTNCCEDPIEIAGTISLDCSDGGCSHQGEISATFTFPIALEQDLTLQIGQIVHNTSVGTDDAVGYNIFALPAGVNPMTYYQPFANVPFEVTIPAGSTSYTIPAPIAFPGVDGLTWICHRCLFPITDLYIKPVSTTQSIRPNFTNNQGATVHNVDNIVDDPDCVDCSEGSPTPRWQVYNTASIVGGDHEYTDKCDDMKCWEYGDFAYWQSTDTYPRVKEVWGDLCGEPIRHHKYPDSCVSHIHDGLGENKLFKDNNHIFPIGVKVNHQSVLTAIAQAVTDNIITQAQADSIVGYRIVRGNRVGNKSIDAKGLIFNMWRYSRDSELYYYPNYPYNDLHHDDFLAPDKTTYQGSTTSSPHPSTYYGGNDRYTFHSPDVHFVNTGLGDILKIETNEYGQSEGYFAYSDCQAKHKFPSTATHAIALGFGVAAALSATGEKVCKTIEHKSDVHTVNFPVPRTMTTATQVIAIPSTPPIPPIAPIALFAPGTIPGTVGIDTGYHLTWFNNVHSTNLIRFEYDATTGLPIVPAGPSSAEVKTTCKGQTYQLINANIIVNSILGFGGAGLGIIIQKVILGIIEAGKVLDTIKTLLPYKNYSIQYNSVGKYNNYTCVPEGNRVRRITKSAYLDPFIQNVDEPITDTTAETIKINNWQRESSVYLKIGTPLAVPAKVDDSRVTMDQQFAALSAADRFDSLDKRFNRTVSSYYASVKRNVPNQYGQICNIEYLETNSCSFKLATFYTDCELTVFGGDTFIGRFGLKRKMPFFTHTMCGLQNGSDVLYSDLGNVAFPNYYFNTEQPLFERMGNHSISINDLESTLQAIVGTNQTRLDAKTPKFFYQNGYAHMFNYGIPYFLVESDINVDYRHGQNNLEKDFYPHNSDLKNWLDEEQVPIKNDNYYFYNRTYSKQNKETPICTSCILDIKELTCQNPSDNRLIYSEPTDAEDKNDNWLIFKANSKYDFPLKLGRLITADGIENDKVLVRFTKGTQIFNAYNTLQATGENIQVGTGGMFQTRPQDMATTKLGYAGTQHRDILHTEYGHIWGDGKSGQIFNLAGGITELTDESVANWFKENLPFQLQKDFPTIAIDDLDNNLYGIGLHYCFDKRFKRILVTKLDYKVIDVKVKYDEVNKIFYILDEDSNHVEVQLRNPKYFCNKSWTVSYFIPEKAWVSFHSYRPNFYVQNVDSFDSAFTRTDTQKLYTHNITNKSYQVFYGKLEPFIVEFLAKKAINNNFVHSFEYNLDVIRYHNEFDTFYNRQKTFNKGILYNERQCSSLLEFVVSDPENMAESNQYPKRTSIGYQVLTTNSENLWRFNDFWDVVSKQTNNMPFFNYDCNNVDKKLNYKALNNNREELDRAGLRQHMLRARLINDRESLYNFIVTFANVQQTPSIR